MGREMAKKPARWVQGIIDSYLPMFGDGDDERVSEEIIAVLRAYRQRNNLAPKSLKNPLTQIRKAIEAEGYELLASFSAEEWDEMSSNPKVRIERRQAQEKQNEDETLMTELIELLSLDDETVETLTQAAKKSGLGIAEIIKRGALIEAKTQLTKVQNEIDFSAMTHEEVAASNSKESSQELAKRAIEAIIEHNDYQATEHDQKWYVSQGFVSTFLKEKLGANVHAATVKKVIQQQKTRINDHNSKHELVPLSNRKGTNSPWSTKNIEF